MKVIEEQIKDDISRHFYLSSPKVLARIPKVVYNL